MKAGWSSPATATSGFELASPDRPIVSPIAIDGSHRSRYPARAPGATGATLIMLVLVLSSCSSGGTANGTVAATPMTLAGATVPTATSAPSNSTESDIDPQPTVTRPAVSDETNQMLIDAAWSNDISLARELIAQGADVNYKDNTEQSAYLIATSEGYLELLEITLDNGADVGSLDSFNGTGLIRAAERGHSDIVGRLLQTDIDVNHINNLGWTALHEAIILGDGDQRAHDTVRLLIAGGADVQLPSQRDGAVPLVMAASRGQNDIAATIQSALDAPPIGDPDSDLLAAAGSGDADGAALAIAAGANIETRDTKLRTPLLIAATNDGTAVARVLVALGADPDALDDRHDTPWLVTGVTGSVEMAEILLDAHPDLAILNRFGGTSLIPASERGHLDYVRRVVQTDVDINHVNDLGWTALMEAVLFGQGSATHQEIIRVLLDAGADPTIADADGTTPVQHAVARGYREIVELLTAP